MTRDEILNRVRINLNDAGISFWSTSDVNDSVQDGYDDIAVYTQCIEKSTTVSSTSSLLYYNMHQTISDLISVKAIYNPGNNLWLNPASLAKLRNNGLEWQKATGQCTDFCPISFEYYILWPIYVGASQNYTAIYTAQADTLNASTVPQMPSEYHKMLEDYVTADMLEQAEEYTKAAVYWKSYYESRRKLKNFMASRSNLDRIGGLKESYAYMDR